MISILVMAGLIALCLIGLTTNKSTYPTPTSGSGGLTSLASSSSLTAGYQWFYIDNTTELALDYLVQGEITVGGTVAANSEIDIWAIPSFDGGTTWPDVFTATAGAKTATNAQTLQSAGVLARVLPVVATTASVGYPFEFTVASLFGGLVPKKVLIFVTQNTGTLDGTAANHTYNYAPVDTTNG